MFNVVESGYNDQRLAEDVFRAIDELKIPSPVLVGHSMTAFAGAGEFTLLGIVVPATGRQVHVVGLWRAFWEQKHGQDRLLQAAEADLDRFLATTGGVRPATPLQPTYERRGRIGLIRSIVRAARG